MPVTLNVLKNDADPDNDPLTIAGLPQLVVDHRQRERARRDLAAPTTASSSSCPPSPGDYVFLYAIIDGSERDAAYIRVRVDEADREPPADGDPRRRHDQPWRHPQRVRPRERHRSRRRRDRHRRLVGRRGHRGRAGARLRLPGDGAARRPGPHPVHVHDLRRQRRPVDGHGRRRGQRHRHARPAARRHARTPSRCGRVARRRHACWSTTTTPRAARCASSACPTSPAPSCASGRAVRRSSSRSTRPPSRRSRSATTSPTRAATRPDRSSRSVSCPIGDVNRPPVARPDVARTVSGRADRHPRARQRLRSRRRCDPDRDDRRPADVRIGQVVNVDGTIRYSPRLGESGSDRLRYTIVDANGDRAVGEVVIGVLPADGENRPPTATNDAYTVIAGSRHPVVRRAGQRLRPRRRPAGDRRGRRRFRRRRHRPVRRHELRTAAHARRCAPTRTCRSPTRSPTAAAAPTERSSRSRSSSRTSRSRRSRSTTSPGPCPRGQSLTINVLANDSDPDGRVADLTVRSDSTRCSRSGPTARSPSPIRRRPSVSGTRSPTPTASSATAQVTVIVLDNVAPVVAPLRATTPFETPIASGRRRPGDRRRRRRASRSPAANGVRGGSVAGRRERQGRARRAVHARRRASSASASFSYLADDQHGPQRLRRRRDHRAAAGEHCPDGEPTARRQAEAGVDDAGRPRASSSSTPTWPSATNCRSRSTPAVRRWSDRATRSSSHRRSTPRAARTTSATPSPTRPAPSASSTVHDHGHRAERAGTDRRRRSGAHDPGHGRRRSPCWPTTSTRSGRGLTIIGANVSDGSGTASVSGTQVVYQPSAGYFGATTLTYTVEDARRTVAGQAVGTVGVTVIGRPGTPSTPQATADNATATVTWGLPPANGAPITAVELQAEGLAPISLGATSSHTLTGLVNGRPYRFQVRAQNEAGWGEWSACRRRSRPTPSPAGSRPPASRSATVSSRSPGRHRPTRARR